LPDWQGVWIAEGLTPSISGFPQPGARSYKLVGNEAPWNEVGRARVQAAMAAQAGLKANGWGYPLMMDSSAPLPFLVTPHATSATSIPMAALIPLRKIAGRPRGGIRSAAGTATH
jgi:hypothetical protein